jgi:hypothetical protein
MTVGYFGIPGRFGGKTHLVHEGKPVCHVRLHPESRYEWCSDWANIRPECTRCLPHWNTLMIERSKAYERRTIRAAK